MNLDSFQLNAGSMLVRSRPSALDFMNRVRVYGDEHRDLSEQDCIRDIVNRDADGEKEQTLWIPQYKINAFPEEIRCWDKYDKGWERGVFLVHFAGAVSSLLLPILSTLRTNGRISSGRMSRNKTQQDF